MRKILIVIFLMTFARLLSAQQQQGNYFFFLNPAYINPASAGDQEAPVVYLGHSQQWLGIDGAPSVSSLSFHMPFKKKMGIGVNIQNHTRGLFNTTSAEAFSSYRLKINRRQSINFGLSLGMDYNRLMGDPAGVEDPLILKYLSAGQMQMTSKFGAMFYSDKLSLGFVMPRLVAPVFEGAEQRMSFSPLKNFIFSASYELELIRRKLLLTPNLNYHIIDQGEGVIELAAKMEYKKDYWAGAAYRSGRGMSAFLGARLKQRYGVSYAFELPVEVSNPLGAGSHQVNLSIFLVKPEKSKKPNGYLAARRAKLAEMRKKKLEEEKVDDTAENQNKSNENKKAVAKPDQPNGLMPSEQSKADEDNRLAQEKLREEQLEQERLAQQQKEKDRLAQQQKEKERLEKERLAQQEKEKERLEQERLKKEWEDEVEEQRRLMALQEQKEETSNEEEVLVIEQEEEPIVVTSKDKGDAYKPRFEIGLAEDFFPDDRMRKKADKSSEQKEETMYDGFYIVLKGFADKTQASAYADELQELGYDSQVGLHKDKNQYMVYIMKSDSPDEISMILMSYQQIPDLSEAHMVGIQGYPEPQVDAVADAGAPKGGKMTGGYYINLKGFDSEDQAAKYTDELQGKGYDSEYGLHTETGKYMVYIMKSDSEDEVTVLLMSYLQIPELSEAHILHVEGPAESETPPAADPTAEVQGKEMQDGFYIALKEFDAKDQAAKYAEDLQEKGYDSQYGTHPDTGKYIVYLMKSDSEDEIAMILMSYQQVPELSEAKLLQIGGEAGSGASPKGEGNANAQELESGFYIALKGFDDSTQAAKYAEDLQGKGYDSQFGLHSESNKYIVYLMKSASEDEISMILMSYQQIPELSDAYMLEVK